MRHTVIALRLADLARAPAEDRVATYYTGLLMNSYCHADASEQARWFGDDISFKGEGFGLLDKNAAHQVAYLLRRIADHGGLPGRARRLAAVPVGYREMLGFLNTHVTLGSQFAIRIGLGERVATAVSDVYEQWDGKGEPSRRRGDAISLPARLAQFASPIEVFARHHGEAAAIAAARRRRR